MSESQLFIVLANIWIASSNTPVGLFIGLFYLAIGIVIGMTK